MGCCGQNRDAHGVARAVVEQQGLLGATPRSTGGANVIRMEYTGQNQGSISYRNPFGGSGQTYRGGVGVNRYADVDPLDEQFLLETGLWRTVTPGSQERPRKDLEAIIVHSPEAQAAADQAAAEAEVEMPTRPKRAAKKDD